MKNRKFSTPLGMGLTASLLAAGWAGAATLTINQLNAPALSIVSNTANTSFARSFYNHATAGTTTRGQTFLAPDTGDANTAYSVTGLTLQKSVTQSFGAGDNLRLWVFAYNPSNNGNTVTNWANGDGWDPDTSNSDPLNGTGSTLLTAATISLNGLSLTGNTYFTFDFSDSPLTMAENTAYGFLLGYTDAANAQYFEYKVDSDASGQYANGVQIRTGDTSNTSFTAAQDLTFWVTGTAVPEPSAPVLLLLGAAGLLRRRRR